MANNVSDIRKYYLQLRDSVKAADHQAKSAAAMTNMKALLDDKFGRADLFLCFYPLKSEIDFRPLYAELLSAGHSLCFPRVRNQEMDFCLINNLESDFARGRFSVMEPVADCKIMSQFEGAICITPGLAFDKAHNRIGYGGGFYDRFFAAHPSISRIGICFDFQVAPALEAMPHDVPLNYIVTDTGYF